MDHFSEEIIIDHPGSDGWSHLTGRDLAALHAFARSIGLQRQWFQNKRGKNQPHYDLRGYRLQQAVMAGAKLVTTRYIIQYLAHHHGGKPSPQIDIFSQSPTFTHPA